MPLDQPITQLARVISVRGKKRPELEADPNFVYVGRAVHRMGWRASIFGNPFRPQDCGRTDNGSGQQHAARLFELRLAEAIAGETIKVSTDEREAAFKRIAAGLLTLQGKVLGCWCCTWSPGEPIVKPCHAIVLAQAVNDQEQNADA